MIVRSGNEKNQRGIQLQADRVERVFYFADIHSHANLHLIKCHRKANRKIEKCVDRTIIRLVTLLTL